MTNRNVAALSAESPPAVYEVFTLSGKTYEVHLEPTLGTLGLVLISRDAGEEDKIEDRDTLQLFGVSFQVGHPGTMIVDDLEDSAGHRRVRTPEVVAIVQLD